MTLTTEDGGDILGVDSSTMDEVLRSDAFGKFVVLAASDEDFIQAANDWEPSEEYRAFLRDHESDPWLVEYRESGRLFRAAGRVTLQQVRNAFQRYLSGALEWRAAFAWAELRL
jgi:hypothetical protein